MNPILPDNCFVPDAEAHVMPDGRLYLYGSWDLSNQKSYCSNVIHCFSTDDMINWTDHGVIFRNDNEFNGIPWNPNTKLYAPDAIYANGKYYLYLCGSENEEGVAVSDSPIGPFSVAEPIDIADGDSIDPAVFVDKDNKKYYFWGQFSLRGGELCDDMKTLKPETVKKDLLTEWEHGFHEGASIRRRGDKYYMLYTDVSRGKATCISYAVSDHPLGPYKKGGVIIDNAYCDPHTWNNHGSIEEYKGQWYVFYHRSSQNSGFCRRVCVERIEFDRNGMIKEVVQTSSGSELAINARNAVPARAACRMMANCFITDSTDGEVLLVKPEGHWSVPDWAEYKHLDFGDTAADRIVFTVKGTGDIIIRIDGNAEIGKISVNTENYATVSAPLKRVTGIHPLWLFFHGSMEIKSFRIE